MQKYFFILCGLIFFTGCEAKSAVPDVNDVENIIVKGKHYTAEEFYKEFCPIKETNNPICQAVQHQAYLENIKEFWKENKETDK